MPIEEMSGIGFPVRRDVLMTGNGLNRIMFGNGGQQGLQAGVLCFGKRLEIAAFQFDTDGKGIAFFSALKRRYAGMIGHVVAGNELDGFAFTADEKMAGDAQGVDDAEKRMLVRVDLVGKQFFHRTRVVLKRRKTFSSGSRGLKLGERVWRAFSQRPFCQVFFEGEFMVSDGLSG